MLHDDLLSQANALISLDKRRPRQSNLRRAVSTAYYAVFHALGHHVARQMIGSSKKDDELRALLRRALEHSEMKSALKGFAGGNPSLIYRDALGGRKVPVSLQRIAAVFVDLQEKRHLADYDLSTTYAKATAQFAVNDAAEAVGLLQDLTARDPENCA